MLDADIRGHRPLDIKGSVAVIDDNKRAASFRYSGNVAKIYASHDICFVSLRFQSFSIPPLLIESIVFRGCKILSVLAFRIASARLARSASVDDLPAVLRQ